MERKQRRPKQKLPFRYVALSARLILVDEEWETWATKPNPGYSELASMFSHNPISVTIDFMLCTLGFKMSYLNRFY